VHVALVNQYYPPDTSATAGVFSDIVAAFADAGHSVSVVCGRPSYAPSERRGWKASRREVVSNSVNIIRVGSSSFDRKIPAGRVVNYLSYLILAAIWLALRPVGDVIVVGSDPPLAVVAAALAARRRPVVYSLRDLHPDFAIRSGMLRAGRVTRLWELVHRWALRRCAMVICLGDDMAHRVSEKGVPLDRIRVVRDGCVSSPDRSLDEAVVNELRGGASFVAMHAGNLGGTVPWETLVTAREKLVPSIDVVFVGDGVNADVLRDRGVRVEPYRAAEQLAEVMAAGDVQIVAIRPGLEGLVVPSKLYTALAHGRPILAVVRESSDVARIVNEHGCGPVVDPEDPAGVATQLMALAESHVACERSAAGSRRAALALDRARELQRFVDTVDAVRSTNLPRVAKARRRRGGR